MGVAVDLSNSGGSKDPVYCVKIRHLEFCKIRFWLIIFQCFFYKHWVIVRLVRFQVWAQHVRMNHTTKTWYVIDLSENTFQIGQVNTFITFYHFYSCFPLDRCLFLDPFYQTAGPKVTSMFTFCLFFINTLSQVCHKH